MSGKLGAFYQEKFAPFFAAYRNLFFFLPYFFSVKTLSATLFSPWKNIKTSSNSFSINAWFDELSFNLISRFMGFFMRFSILVFYVFMQILMILLFPVVVLIYALMMPILFFEYLFSETNTQKKERKKAQFLSSHLLDQSHKLEVENWFEMLWKEEEHDRHWWYTENLREIPPLARDWTTGYTPTLDALSEDLLTTSYQQPRRTIIGRVEEIDQLERILSKTSGANAVVVGEEGVGKHTIIDALAKRMYEGSTVPELMYKRLVKLNLEKVMATTTDVKQREDSLENLFKEAESAGNIIIFIDTLDKYLPPLSSIDISIPVIKHAAASTIHFLAITTPIHYEQIAQHNEKFAQLFTKLDVSEVSADEAKMILLESVTAFEKRHTVTIPYETVLATLTKGSFYITSIPFPQNALRLLDDACIYAEKRLGEKIVTPATIDKVISERTHISTTVTDDLRQKLLNIEHDLNSQVFGQEEAMGEIGSSLRRSFLLQEKRKKPLASLLFLGPTGVGKTNTAQVLAQTFFDSAKALSRFDMSEFQTQSDIAKLIGTQDSVTPGLLISALEKNPYGVLLLDEIEKAHPDLLNIFLTLLDEGYITSGDGKRVDGKNLVVIATSNAKLEDHPFKPEFLNRYDAVVTFKPLTGEVVKKLAMRRLTSVEKDIEELYKIHLTVKPETVDMMVGELYNPEYGARDLERVLRKKIEDQLAKLILEKKISEGQSLTL